MKSKIKKELKSLCTEYTKVYEKKGNIKRIMCYPAPQQYVSQDTHKLRKVKPDVQETQDGSEYVSVHNNYTARFNKSTQNEGLFSIQKGMYKVSMRAIRNKKAAVCPMETVLASAKKGKILFKNLAPGAELEYTVCRKGVKENIVLHDKNAACRYSFAIDCENVVPEYQEGKNSIVFYSQETGEKVFVIPAPYMVDAKGAISRDVILELKTGKKGTKVQTHITISADPEWLESDDRVFPIKIDPQVNMAEDNAISVSGYSIDNGQTYSADSGVIVELQSTATTSADATDRQYLMFNVQNTELFTSNDFKLYVYEYNSETCTRDTIAALSPCETTVNGDVVECLFDITEYYDQYSLYEAKMYSTSEGQWKDIVVFGEESAFSPALIIDKQYKYAVNMNRAVTQDLGRFGIAGVDTYTGAQLFTFNDFSWGGNRMPVTIQHMYNGIFGDYQYTNNSEILLNTADFHNMKIGNGWKLNVMQSIKADIDDDGDTMYVYTGANGELVELIQYEKTVAEEEEEVQTETESESTSDATVGSVNDNDNLDPNYVGKYVCGPNNELVYDKDTRVLTVNEKTKLYFDTSGRLIKIEDEYENTMDITYSDEKITSVTDGAGREFTFIYKEKYLTTITAPDGSEVRYKYIGDTLSEVRFTDGRKVIFRNENGNPVVILKDANNNELQVIEYEYFNKFAKYTREYGVKNGERILSKSVEIKQQDFSNRREVETVDIAEEQPQKTNIIILFDDYGNIVSGYYKATDMQNYIPLTGARSTNFLVNHNFERPITAEDGGWSVSGCENSTIQVTAYSAHFGEKSLSIDNDSNDETVVSQSLTLRKTCKYTFSAYIRVPIDFAQENEGVCLRVTDASGNILAESEKLYQITPGYTRIWITFYNSYARELSFHIVTKGRGIVYVDGAQLEDSATVNPYNMIENGSFNKSLNCWQYSSDNDSISIGYVTNINNIQYLTYQGTLTADEFADYPHQSIPVVSNSDTREVFTLSGWAYCYGEPCDDTYNRKETTNFRLHAKINYEDESVVPDEYDLWFCPTIDSVWQTMSMNICKTKPAWVKDITVYCCYSNKAGRVEFTDLQLVRQSIETGLSAEDFEESEESTSENEFKEAFDVYGNQITETIFEDDSPVTLYRSFGYSDDGNDLMRITDESGSDTTILVDEETSNVTAITDRCGNVTEYEYDTAGRVDKLTNKDSSNNVLTEVSYQYDNFDNMTKITRDDGMSYDFAYNEFRKPISVSVGNQNIVSYLYKNGCGRLKSITLANGDVIDVVYNSRGELITETRKDASGVTTAKRKYDYDLQGNVVRTLDTLSEKEYVYTYSESNIIRVSQNNVVLDENDCVLSRARSQNVDYAYDRKGRINRQFIDSNDTHQEYSYTWLDTGVHQTFSCNGTDYGSDIYIDALGRMTSENISLQFGNLQRSITYLPGEQTDEHKANGKCKTDATTNLVNQITYTGGRTLSYTYDDEERINRVVDSNGNTIEYTYDSLGRLVSETVGNTQVNTMTYDAYGNILTKNGVQYEYDTVWKDRLVKVGSDTITYDLQGNPTSYKGHTLTWKNDRMMSYDSNTYTYDCNGIRTSKTVSGVTHTYELDGSIIIKETWGNNQLVPMYDITGSVLGILYNSIPYYFMRNLQNDVIGVANIAAKGITVVINKGITAHAQKGLNHFMFDDMILSDLVGSGLQNNGYNPIYNKLLDQVAKYIMRANGQWARSFMYLFANAGISSLLSGWY